MCEKISFRDSMVNLQFEADALEFENKYNEDNEHRGGRFPCLADTNKIEYNLHWRMQISSMEIISVRYGFRSSGVARLFCPLLISARKLFDEPARGFH